jgi:hypothetical protein
MAMARELVTEKGIGESADAVWKQLQRQQAEVFGVRAVETSPSEMEAEPPERDVPEVIIPPPAPIPVVHSKTCPGAKPRGVRRLLPPRRANWVCFEASQNKVNILHKAFPVATLRKGAHIHVTGYLRSREVEKKGTGRRKKTGAGVKVQAWEVRAIRIAKLDRAAHEDTSTNIPANDSAM